MSQPRKFKVGDRVICPIAPPYSTRTGWDPGVASAVEALASAGGQEERGAVFTKGGVVDAILDLCGYMPDAQLEDRRLLEPSFGEGEFLLAAIRRLLASFMQSGVPMSEAYERLSGAIRGVELHRSTFNKTAKRVARLLVSSGFDQESAEQLTSAWLTSGDFLLSDVGDGFDFVVGNPPYVRQERIPAALLKAYRKSFTTLYDRADLYVLFYERALDLLKDGGVLGFICANRWIKNKYGGPLREKVANGFHLRYFIDLEQADAFQAEVIAYPAITVIERSAADRTLVVESRGTVQGLDELVAGLLSARPSKRKSAGSTSTSANIAVLTDVMRGRDPGLLDTPAILPILSGLEAGFPTLEAAGASVGIGVATGADRVFISDYDKLPVEDCRKLRLAMAGDCADGEVTWSGKGVVNPYLESGELAPLADYPRFAQYLKQHAPALRKRHTAQRQPSKWYRTIDRIYPQLTERPKLLIPDIKGQATVALDDGSYYPHHNLYVVTSDTWDLRALQAILRSSVALMFVAAYSVRMSGGFLRFQAQYLRRIRCPQWAALDKTARRSLIEVGRADQDSVDAVVLPLYGLSAKQVKAVAAYAEAARVGRKGE